MKHILRFKILFLILIALLSTASYADENLPEVAFTHKGSEDTSYGLSKRLKIIGALFLVFIPIGLYAKKKNGSIIKNSNNLINILEKRTIDPNSSLILVRTHQRTFLLGKSSERISFLTEVGEEDKNKESPDDLSYFIEENYSLISNS